MTVRLRSYGRLRPVLPILMAAALLGAGILPARSNVIVFQAGTLRGVPLVSGYCWTQSIASGRSDAYRCMAGNEIHDPCFAGEGATVACPSVADTSGDRVPRVGGLRIRLTKPLPPAARAGRRTVWMMRLAGGAVCNRGTGTIVAGFPFYCTGPLVCSDPGRPLAGVPVFVTCGRAQSAITVSGRGKYLAATLYE